MSDMRDIFFISLLSLLIAGCTESPEAKVHRLIDDQNRMYVREAEQIIAQQFPRGTADLYQFYSTWVDCRPAEKGGVKGTVHVVFARKDRPTIQTRDHGVIVSSMTVIFESADYKRVLVDVSGETGSTTKEVFKTLNVRK